MTTSQLKIMLAKYKIEFLRKMESRHQSVIHMGIKHDENLVAYPHEYNYLIKKPRIIINYTCRWDTVKTVYVLKVNHVSTQDNLQSFYGHSSRYGHNVYITADDEFINRIVSIEEN